MVIAMERGMLREGEMRGLASLTGQRHAPGFAA